ncbi:hypothetical protein Peur_057548 [Populus x canadensis]|jgi:hypothetical protein
MMRVGFQCMLMQQRNKWPQEVEEAVRGENSPVSFVVLTQGVIVKFGCSFGWRGFHSQLPIGKKRLKKPKKQRRNLVK